jgi:hypothetical protein
VAAAAEDRLSITPQQFALRAMSVRLRQEGRVFGHHEDRTPPHGYEPTREAAMAAFAKSWRRE